jgi:hypothetical protein
MIICFNSIRGKGTYFCALQSIQKSVGTQISALCYVYRSVSRFCSKEVVSVPEPTLRCKRAKQFVSVALATKICGTDPVNLARSIYPFVRLKQLNCSAGVRKTCYGAVLVLIITDYSV